MQNISTNIWILGRRTDPKLGEVYYLFISYDIKISWLNTLNGLIWNVLSDVTPKGGEVCVDLVFSEKKNICKLAPN